MWQLKIRPNQLLAKAHLDPKVVLTSILESVTYVKAEEIVKEVEDDLTDNMVLECALSANAEFVVSGDIYFLSDSLSLVYTLILFHG